METPSERTQIVQQTPSPLPSLPDHDLLSTSQWAVLEAIVDTVIPPLSPEENATRSTHRPVGNTTFQKALRAVQHGTSRSGDGDVLAMGYLSEAGTSTPDFRDSVKRLVGSNMDSEQQKGFLFILTALSTRFGAVLLTGTSTPLPDLPVIQRERILLGWANARLPFYRSLFRSFTSVAKFLWLRQSPTLGHILCYPKSPINHNFGPGFPFVFLQFPPQSAIAKPTSDDPEIIDTDVLIIGSGCTGAVAASILSASGLSVIVTDRSYYWPPQHLPMSESSAASHLFANGGVVVTDDGNMNILSGSCWGGGGTVNWSASLQLQGFVRDEWASAGLPYFTSAQFQNDMDAVCERMGVSTAHIEHNFTNQKLLEGARRLGMNAKAVPQNTGGEAHQCGYCTLGCGSCGKKGPTESWLPEAARAGAKFIEGFECTEILFEDKGGARVAVGAKGIWTSRDSNAGVSGPDRQKRHVVIRARKSVIVACGALATPLLLKRSGLKNPHIGKHLHLHPVSMLGAVYDDNVSPWDGPILTSVVNDFENLDRRGHGVKLEATTMLPGLFLPIFEWQDGLSWKVFAAKMARMTGYISIARDEGEGMVYADPKDKGRICVRYQVKKEDRQHIARGLEALAKIQFIGGAREIFVNVPGISTFVREDTLSSGSQDATAGDCGINDPAFQSWLDQLRALALTGHSSDSGFASAHQMGSARMGSSPKTSAVDATGRVWGTSGLYVVDTSVFPSASGVNPMITAMATARGIARGIAKEAASQSGLGTSSRSKL